MGWSVRYKSDIIIYNDTFPILYIRSKRSLLYLSTVGGYTACMLYCQVLPPFIPMYTGSLDRHEAIYTDYHAPHSLVICFSKGGNGTSQARLPTHTWTSSGQLGHLAVTAWYAASHKHSTAWCPAFQTMVCACAMFVNGLEVCVRYMVTGWVSQQT